MTQEPRFLITQDQKNIVLAITSLDSPLWYENKPMEQLRANHADAAQEKHLPQVEYRKNVVKVEVGSTHHPMAEDHSIQWIFLQSAQGCQRKCLHPSHPPIAEFALMEGDAPIAAYAYCNLHGLWRTDIRQS